MKKILLSAALVMGILFSASGQKVYGTLHPDELEKPVQNGMWIQPAQGVNAQPVWGFADGIRIGLTPLKGPHGLIRIYTPYLGIGETDPMNYIAYEPINKVTGKKGYSELETSQVDGNKGKVFWSSNTAELPEHPDIYRPAAGVIGEENGKQTLTVYIISETFKNGADVYAKVKFTEGKPYEIELTAYVSPKSVELSEFVLTATMGNKPRLRKLYLGDKKTVRAPEIWPGFEELNFTERKFFPLEELIIDSKGGAWFIAANDEKDHTKAQFVEGTAPGWQYKGKKATQYWYCPNPTPGLTGSVNGRYTYWAGMKDGKIVPGKFLIPGGIAYENFEMTERPVKNEQVFIFGITPLSPEKFIKKNIK